MHQKPCSLHNMKTLKAALFKILSVRLHPRLFFSFSFCYSSQSNLVEGRLSSETCWIQHDYNGLCQNHFLSYKLHLHWDQYIYITFLTVNINIKLILIQLFIMSCNSLQWLCTFFDDISLFFYNLSSVCLHSPNNVCILVSELCSPTLYRRLLFWIICTDKRVKSHLKQNFAAI